MLHLLRVKAQQFVVLPLPPLLLLRPPPLLLLLPPPLPPSILPGRCFLTVVCSLLRRGLPL